MQDLVFVSSLPEPDVGKGRPGVPRSAFTKPTKRQPNRGLTADDPEFTCTICRKIKPMEENYRIRVKNGYRLAGRCRPCHLANQREANDRQAAKTRGPDYVLPVSKESLSPVTDGHRKCLDCDLIKLLSEFYVDKTVSSGYQSSCKACRSSARVARWESLTPEQRASIQAHQWTQWIWRFFQLTVDEYEAMLLAQGGVCAVCKQISDRRLCVDHDHSCCPGKRSCGKCVRQLLCTGCNFTIGGIERVGSVDPFGDYLARHARVCDSEVSVEEGLLILA